MGTHEYKVYVNGQFETEAVKQGWSWPGFCFAFIWMLVKKLWVLAAIVFGILFVLTIMEEATGNPGVISSLLGLVVSIVTGIKGNSWREKNLIKRGFTLKGTATAKSPSLAMGQLANNAEEQIQREV